jgi:two-component system, sensor histidine kinase PdtaS
VLDIKNFTKTGNLDSTIWKEEKGIEEFNPLTVNLNRFDSTYNALYNSQLTEMETKYKTKSVKDSLDKTLYANAIKQVKINRQYWVITFITLLALLTGFLLYRINKEKKRAIADRHTIELLKEEADHRVKNTFSNIDSIIRDVKNKTNDVSSIQILEQRIEPLRLLFKMLGNTATGAVDLQQYFETISTSLALSFLNTQNVQVMVDAPVTVEGEKASKLGLIINELLTNSFKHAFKNNSSGVIKIECKKETAGKYRLTVNDSGAGWPEGTDTKRRGGITQIKALAQQLDATCEIKSSEGAQFEFWFL